MLRLATRPGGVPFFRSPIVRKFLSRFALALAAGGAALLAIPPLRAQDTFERRELTIPVRDGVKLFAVALVPKSMPAPLPIMLIRTPYSAAGRVSHRAAAGVVQGTRRGRLHLRD